MNHFPIFVVLFAFLSLAGSANAQTTHQVSMGGNAFNPANLTISTGDTVQWTWSSGFHNVESGVNGNADGNFRSGNATSTPTTFAVTFDSAFLASNPMANDVYPYYCAIHVFGGMRGSIMVSTPAVITGYGCGVNPSGSLSLVGGLPRIGTTFSLGVSNPLGNQSGSSLGFLAVALTPDPSYPCGTQLPGFGMAGGGVAGELLIGFTPPPVLVLGPQSLAPGSMASFGVPIPADSSLTGLSVYFQGVVLDPLALNGNFYGLTTGIDATIGS